MVYPWMPDLEKWMSNSQWFISIEITAALHAKKVSAWIFAVE
jgi:hypothetical protein